ncbi:flagellar motor stator protein MotA [Sphingomonas sp. AP4-R1]|uniref:flagellar motor stator protein MotA n=1 Tax=Sphingomonas sp. AP4-R1 TaxID=2735134 RepID=UPI001493B833|nr:flagellar motor stator protein MotA [Sphingomonas sp. AP4-R1]QJU57456.1 flagellar motor stator protein MotA [Sphingomonas sp. AP4-R1]
MFNGIGVAVILVCVFGSFLMSGGNIAVILHALPHEMMAIVGAGIGAFMLSNSSAIIRKAWGGTLRAFRGPRWTEGDYRDLLALMFSLLLLFRKGGSAKIENHIDQPESSDIFSRYPRLLADGQLIDFLCDYLRMMTVSFDDPHQLSEAMEGDIERHHAEELAPQHAIQVMADGLPALGIVAAVLGVIKTMSSIDQPTDILGAMIGGALVGTFLGVLLSYCFVGPIASKLHQIVDADAKPYSIIKTAITAHAQGLPPQVAIELARRMTPSAYAPSFSQLESSLDRAQEQFREPLRAI